MYLTSINEQLKKNGYKLTTQRKAIIQVLFNNETRLLTVSDIYNYCTSVCNKTNLSTIYRNLQTFEGLGIVHKILNNTGTALYKIIYIQNHHHHIICKSCGRTSVMDFCPLDNFKISAKNNGFILTNHKIELYGYCEYCKKQILKV